MLPDGVDLKALVDLRHHLHQKAELSGQEKETARIMADFFSTCQPAQLLTGLGGHGVAAVFDGPEPGPVTVLRAELDALPIHEACQIPHLSCTEGVSHKCGHDGHLAILAGVAQNLAIQPLTRGRVVLLCQPAEETGQGAAAVAADPRFLQLKPERLFALHNLPGYESGQVIIRPGAFAAGSAGLTIELTGETSHAAYPEQGKSPDQAMAQLITELVTLPIPLEIQGHLALITITHTHLGEPAFGITPGQATIMATLRSDSDTVLADLKQKSEDLAARVAQRHNLQSGCHWSEEFPVTNNDLQSAEAVELAAQGLGIPAISPEESPFRWSEDFGHLLALGKGAMFGLGTGVDHPPLHAGQYDFNDDVIEVGVSLFVHVLRSQ